MRPQKNGFEWTVFVLGLILTTATVGYLIYDSFTRGGTPPDLRLVLGDPQPAPAGGIVVPVWITNRGATTAEGVQVEVLLHGPDSQRERAELEFPFVPRHARRQGWVGFRSVPAQGGRLEGVVLGYRQD